MQVFCEISCWFAAETKHLAKLLNKVFLLTCQTEIFRYMEPNRFLFKLSAIVLQYLLMIAVLIPFVYAAHLVKYQFNMEEVVFIRVLFWAIALAMPIVVANAFAFAKYQRIELAYYLKPHQKHTVEMAKPASEIQKAIAHNLSAQPFWDLLSQSENRLNFSVKHLMIKDLVEIHLKPQSDGHTQIAMMSRPARKWAFIDFARNYKNILQVLKAA